MSERKDGMEFKDLVGTKHEFYGATEKQFKLGADVWEVLEDECDGYRSMLGTIERKVSDAIFFKKELARVVVLEDAEIEGWKLVDTADGHVWLRFGTEHGDGYYPWFTFDYQPKPAPQPKPGGSHE